MPLEENHFYRFGSFRLDPAKRLLLRGQKSVPLMPKAFDTLLVLVENRDRMVGKDELMKTLWPDSFVEEANLAQNVAVLRKALGDSPEEHRYILTVPGRGYRFAASVIEETGQEDTDLVVERHSRSRVTVEESSLRKTRSTTPTAFLTLFKRSRKWVVGVAVIAALVLAVLFRLTWHKAPPLGESDSILVSDFVNTTGEPIFDGPLKQALTVKLAESPYFRIEDDTKVRQTLTLMGRPADERVVLQIAREVCERSGAKVLIGGSILRLGDKYVLDLDAQNCLSGVSLTHQEISAERQDQVLNRLGQMIPPLRRKLGESLSSIQKFDTPIEQATTNSLAALKAYTSGDEKRAQGQEVESIPYYKMAIELDPNFAIAYSRLGVIYRDITQGDLADQYQKAAFERREHVSEKEKFYIAAHYYADVTYETDKAIQTYDLWTQTYPRDWIPFNNLATEYARVGWADQAIAPGLRALHLNPDHGFPYHALSFAYLRAGRFPEAKAIIQKAIAAQKDGFGVHLTLYWIAFAEGDESAITREVNWFKNKPLRAYILNQQAWAAASLGQVGNMRHLFDQTRAAALEQGLSDYAAQSSNDEAQLEAEFGNVADARHKADLSLRLFPEGFDSLAGAAMAFAMIGDSPRAESLAKQAAAKTPTTNLLLNNVSLPTIRAILEMHRRNFSGAIELLRPTTPYEFADVGHIPTAYGIYCRGAAYLDLHSPKDAAAEFQRVVDNHGQVPNSPYWTLAHLGLARAYAGSSDTDKAKAMYREFLALWKNADPDLRPLREAKAEYAKLSASH